MEATGAEGLKAVGRREGDFSEVHGRTGYDISRNVLCY